MTSRKMPLTGDYQQYLVDRLKDPAEAGAYLNAALEDDDYRVFLLALRDVADAFGITKVASMAELNRENIYRMLSQKGNPRISSLVSLLRAIGIQLKTEVTVKSAAVQKSRRLSKSAPRSVKGIVPKEVT
ncbi:MAG: addiction module antidote protein [Pyrinomonadaceae bacterium]